MNPLRVCTHCGFTYAEFQARGLLGCAECYTGFGDALFADLLHLHPRLHARPPRPPEPREDIAALRERFSDALRGERYEEAAALRQRMRNLGVTP